LEKQVEALQQDLSSYGSGRKVDASNMLPREPAKHVLQGHREPINQVCFHPTFAVILACSDDGDIKAWDAESGRFEKTFKGHLDAVQDIAFNTDGSRLGMYLRFGDSVFCVLCICRFTL
jgi:platelet-activating factor acetylhydrolase IB subunit alpha